MSIKEQVENEMQDYKAIVEKINELSKQQTALNQKFQELEQDRIRIFGRIQILEEFQNKEDSKMIEKAISANKKAK